MSVGIQTEYIVELNNIEMKIEAFNRFFLILKV